MVFMMVRQFRLTGPSVYLRERMSDARGGREAGLPGAAGRGRRTTAAHHTHLMLHESSHSLMSSCFDMGMAPTWNGCQGKDGAMSVHALRQEWGCHGCTVAYRTCLL